MTAQAIGHLGQEADPIALHGFVAANAITIKRRHVAVVSKTKMKPSLLREVLSLRRSVTRCAIFLSTELTRLLRLVVARNTDCILRQLNSRVVRRGGHAIVAAGARNPRHGMCAMLKGSANRLPQAQNTRTGAGRESQGEHCEQPGLHGDHL